MSANTVTVLVCDGCGMSKRFDCEVGRARELAARRLSWQSPKEEDHDWCEACAAQRARDRAAAAALGGA